MRALRAFLVLFLGLVAADAPLPGGFSGDLAVGDYALYHGTGAVRITLAGNHLKMPMDIDAEIRLAIVGQEVIDKKVYWWQETDVQLKATSQEYGAGTRIARVKWLVSRDDLLAGKRMKLVPGGLTPRKILMSLDGGPVENVDPAELDSFKRENPHFFLLDNIDLSALKFVKHESIETKGGVFDSFRYYLDQRQEIYADKSKKGSGNTSGGSSTSGSGSASASDTDSGHASSGSDSSPKKEKPDYLLAIDGDLWASNDIPFSVASLNFDVYSSVAVGADLTGAGRTIQFSARVHFELEDHGANATSWLEEPHDPSKSSAPH